MLIPLSLHFALKESAVSRERSAEETARIARGLQDAFFCSGSHAKLVDEGYDGAVQDYAAVSSLQLQRRSESASTTEHAASDVSSGSTP